MKNLSILEPQIEKHYAYKKTCSFNVGKNFTWDKLYANFCLSRSYLLLGLIVDLQYREVC